MDDAPKEPDQSNTRQKGKRVAKKPDTVDMQEAGTNDASGPRQDKQSLIHQYTRVMKRGQETVPAKDQPAGKAPKAAAKGGTGKLIGLCLCCPSYVYRTSDVLPW